MKFKELFGTKKPVMAMLHLKGDSEMSVLERAQEEVRCYLENGVEALVVENYFGSAKDCETVLAWLQRAYPDAVYGVNILDSYEKAFELADRYGARFIQIDSVCGHLKPKEDEAFAAKLNAMRQQSKAAVLGGVRFKYQPVRSGRTVEEDLLMGMQRCDAIVVTGEGTGMVTPMQKVKQFRETLSDFPLIMGAGVTPETLEETFGICDGAIVGSYLKENHRDYGDVNPEYVKEFMERKRLYARRFGGEICMRSEIERMLREIETQKDIRILYAVESGSRAWGFASPDSDYDVRYIYVRRPEDYVRVDEVRDTIEGPLDDVMDFSGWDLRKALGLLRRTNPSLIEWAYSPIVYRTTPQWEHIAQEMPAYFDSLSNMHHYFSMAQSNWHKHLKDEFVKAKKYFYVLRPVLCCRWLEKYGTPAPVPFDELRKVTLPEDLMPVVDNLLDLKKAADEAERISHIEALDAFLVSEIERIYKVMSDMGRVSLPGYDVLNTLLRETIHAAWN